MAKQEKKSAYSSKPFLAAMIALAVISIINMFFVYYTYKDTSDTFTTTSAQMHHMNTADGHLNAANAAVLRVAGKIGAGDVPQAQIGFMQGNISEIHSHFETINYEMDEYDKVTDKDSLAYKRFKHARAYLDAYHNKLIQYQDRLNSLISFLNPDAPDYAPPGTPAYVEKLAAFEAFQSQTSSIYQQEIHPLQNSAERMMVAAISIGSADADARAQRTVRILYVTLAVMGAILIAGEVTLFLIARYTRRANEEIDRKNAQFAEASSKLMRSREKMEDIAVTNILTGMKNRYALDQDLTDRLANEQFNIAVFDMDNFRSINDMYGYDFGDEYLSLVAERLRSEFGQHAEIYNITGNEFCAVFNREVSDSQALHYVEGIAAAMSSPYTVFNLTVQLSVSASTYHYVAGDCLNVNSLLVKMDNALRNAKRQGGGQIHQVMNI